MSRGEIARVLRLEDFLDISSGSAIFAIIEGATLSRISETEIAMVFTVTYESIDSKYHRDIVQYSQAVIVLLPKEFKDAVEIKLPTHEPAIYVFKEDGSYTRLPEETVCAIEEVIINEVQRNGKPRVILCKKPAQIAAVD
jgi:hypothetical protein